MGETKRQGTGNPCPAPPGIANRGATCQDISFPEKRIHNPKSARTQQKNAWHGILQTLAQEWTDMHCAITPIGRHSVKQTD